MKNFGDRHTLHFLSFSFYFSCLAIHFCRTIDGCSFETVHLLIPIFHLNSHFGDWKRNLIPMATRIYVPRPLPFKNPGRHTLLQNWNKQWKQVTLFFKHVFLHKRYLTIKLEEILFTTSPPFAFHFLKQYLSLG